MKQWNISNLSNILPDQIINKIKTSLIHITNIEDKTNLKLYDSWRIFCKTVTWANNDKILLFGKVIIKYCGLAGAINNVIFINNLVQ